MSESLNPGGPKEFNPENNRFVREVSGMLDSNKREWLGFLAGQMERTKAALSLSESSDLVGAAREVADRIPLTHTMSIKEFEVATNSGELLCNAKLVDSVPVLNQNTYDFDREHGLDEFVHLRMAPGFFRLHRGGDKVVALHFGHDLLNEPSAYVSFEDLVFAREAQEFHGVENGWQMYLRENFRGSDFKEVAAHFLAASYTDPQEFLSGDDPLFKLAPEGIKLARKRQIFEAKVFGSLPLARAQAIECNTEDTAVMQRLSSSGFNAPKLIHNKFFV